jgi:Photosynthesis system II assembly factor YCF48
MKMPIWSFLRAGNERAVKATALPVALLLSLAVLSAEPRWKIQFFYDHPDSNFDIEDIECPSPQRCVAAGVVEDKKGHEQGMVVVTSDGGEHWAQYEVKERPVSLFFLDDAAGWMVTDHGLWSTAEGGRAWNKVESRKGILQAYFLDANHGYITGLKGMAEETTDGGKHWTKLAAAAEKNSDGNTINYDIVIFQGLHGIIIGAPERPRFDPPKNSAGHPPVTHAMVLETLDGGKKWANGTIPITGELEQLKLSPKGFIVALMLYADPRYSLGSAVFKTPLGTGNVEMIFGERDRSATDIALLNNGGGVLATVEPPGNSTQVPIPGKLKILESRNLRVWQEMDVDYRAVAQRALVAAPDSRHMWVATDTGAILSLVN